MANTIKMVREDGKTADVHPAEVDNYKLGGYEVAEKPKAEPKPKAKSKAKK